MLEERIIYWSLLLIAACCCSISPAKGNVTTPTKSTPTKQKLLSIPLVPHHTLRQRRLSQGLPDIPRFERTGYSRHDDRHLLNNDFEACQVAGLFQGYGTHYADVWCGTPTAQRQTVIVDTGSGVTAFPCAGCTDCGVPTYHIDPLFDGTTSDTYRVLDCDECLKGTCDTHNQCHMGMSYAEGSSWRATEVVDSCFVGGLHDVALTEDGATNAVDDMNPYHAPAFRFDLKFGCQSSVTGLFKTQLADGIMGMDVAPAAFWWQMWAANQIEHKSFSMCFSRSDTAAREGTVAGAMSLGGTDERLHMTPMVYTAPPQAGNSQRGFYVVYIRAVWLREGGAGTSAVPSTGSNSAMYKLDVPESTLNSGRVIVDSGTTDTYFTRKINRAFGDAYKQITGEEYSHGKKSFTPEELAAEPTIMLQLAGDPTRNVAGTPGLIGNSDSEFPLDVLLAIPPEHYYEWDPEEKAYIARFYADEGSGSVIGANSMMGHEVYFDIENQVIGWSESTCDYSALIAPFLPDGTDLVPPSNTEDARTHAPAENPSAAEQTDDFGEDDSDDEGAEEPPHDPSGNTKYDEPPADYGLYQPSQAMCSSLSCQIMVLFAVVAMTIYCAMRFMKRQRYSLTDSHELELHTTSGEFAKYDTGEFT